jgi:hypothetical protein
MAKISKVTGDKETPGEEDYIFECIGCKESHMIRVFPDNPNTGWTFNGDLEKPTISPSILVNANLSCPSEPRCHSFVKDGMIQFLSDCTHELAGQTVQLPEID